MDAVAQLTQSIQLMPPEGVEEAPAMEVAPLEPVYGEEDRAVEDLWREGFQMLYADLREEPQVISAWAYWENMDGAGRGYWNLMVVVEEGAPHPSASLQAALFRWGHSAKPGTLLDWFLRTESDIAALNIHELKGRPVYMRRDKDRVPSWINALESPETKAAKMAEETRERNAASGHQAERPRPWYV